MSALEMAILSIQSQVAAGHVGNSAAIFPLQLLGREVWPVPTVLLSHHPGHGGAQGGALPPALVGQLIDGLASRGCFSRCEAVLSGYLGDAENAANVLRAVALAKAANPTAIYLCDPVLGDDGQLYVSGEIVAAMHNLAAKADIIMPNAFELAVLSGRESATRAEALQAMRFLQNKGPEIVILSSFAGRDTPAGRLDMLAIEGDAAWALNIPDLNWKFHGAGDLLAALFLDAWLENRGLAAALGRACAGIQEVLASTAAQKADELQLIETRNLLKAPTRVFVAERIS